MRNKQQLLIELIKNCNDKIEEKEKEINEMKNKFNKIIEHYIIYNDPMSENMIMNALFNFYNK